MKKIIIIHRAYYCFVFFTSILVGLSISFAQTKELPEKKIKPEDVKFYDINGTLISKKDFMKKLGNDDALWAEQFLKDGNPSLKLVYNVQFGKESLDFSFSTFDGRLINLNKQKEKITVLNFWYVGCAPCQKEMPALNKIVAKYKDRKDIDFFDIDLIAPEDPNGMSNLKTFLEKNRFDFQIAIATKSVMDAFRVRAFPTTVVINKEGKIASYRIFLGKNAKSLDNTLKKELRK